MKPLWIFDLDNTLHDANVHVFPHINLAMTRYIADRLSVSEDLAHDLREHYWHRYGATLKGLVRHHGVDERHFLWHTHQFPDLAGMLIQEKGLRATLRRLPGPKVVLTNAPLHYARAVLSLLRIDGYFSAVYAIESVGFRPNLIQVDFGPCCGRIRSLVSGPSLLMTHCRICGPRKSWGCVPFGSALNRVGQPMWT
jgi:putative hydrolase of the HAD superfamily